MKIINLLFILSLFSLNIQAYSQEDWKIYNACKERVYDNKKNKYDYKACSEMLSHKSALRKYGASNSYSYWIKRLYGD